jgi:hypothetical protein
VVPEGICTAPVEVNDTVPDADRLVNAPVDGVVAPTVPFNAPLKLADKTPVLGTNDILVDEVVTGVFPVVTAESIGYQVALELVLSVIPTFVAFVAVVAVVALLAFPVKAPTKVVEVTEVSPATVVTVEPRETEVDPIVTLELVNAELGIEVNPAPDPENCVAVKTPVLGTYWSLVLDVYSVDRFPVVWLANSG